MKSDSRIALPPLPLAFVDSVASATYPTPGRSDARIGFVKGVSVNALGLARLSPTPAIASMQVLFRGYRFKVLGVLARRIATQVVGMLRGPFSRGQKKCHSVSGCGAVEFLYPHVTVASGIARREPGPAFIGATLIDLWPVAFLKGLRLRTHSHGYSIAAWYE